MLTDHHEALRNITEGNLSGTAWDCILEKVLDLKGVNELRLFMMLLWCWCHYTPTELSQYSALLLISCCHSSPKSSPNTPRAHPWGPAMGVFGEFELWPKFYLRNCCVVCNEMLYCTAICRHAIVLWLLTSWLSLASQDSKELLCIVIKWKFSVLLTLCDENPPVTGGFLSQRPVMRSFDVFFDVRLKKQQQKTVERTMELPVIWDAIVPMWRHCIDFT